MTNESGRERLRQHGRKRKGEKKSEEEKKGDGGKEHEQEIVKVKRGEKGEHGCLHFELPGTGTQRVCKLTHSVASPSDDGSQRLLSCSEPGERNEKDDLKATNTRSRDYRYRTINVLVKLPIGVSVLGRVCSLCMSGDGEPRLWPGKSHNNGT